MNRTMAALFLTALLAAGCSGGQDAPPNLLLITLDTTRADLLGCYGGSVETPVMDRLAAEGVRFDNAWSVTPLTLPSHASILTGLYPPSHGLRENNTLRLSPEILTLAEHLRDQGYRTRAEVSSIILSAIYGLDQGFEVFDEPRDDQMLMPGGESVEWKEILERKAGETTDRALKIMGGSGEKPFFLWVHYYDPHSSYEPPEPFATRYRDNPYAGEVAYVDSQIGVLLDRLKADGLLDNTLVAVVADHGESLGEHGEATHGLFVYRSTIQVPLILHMPGAIQAGTVQRSPVSVVDLAPTFLELMGLPPMPLPPTGGEPGEAFGESFAGLLQGGDGTPGRVLYAESELPLRSYGWSPLYVVFDEEARFIDSPAPELYDLSEDPDETSNIAEERPDAVRDWQRKLAVLADLFPVAPEPSGSSIGEEDRARFMSLGYISGGGVDERADYADLPDPKTRVGLHNSLQRAGALMGTGEFEEAERLLTRVLQQDPDNPGALSMGGVLFAARGKRGLGVASLRKAVELVPGRWAFRMQLANALHNSGDPAGAAREYRAAVELQPSDPSSWFGLGNVLFAAGDLVQAEGAYRQALELDRSQAAVQAALGTTLGKMGDLEGGRRLLQSALSQDRSMVDAWNQLGILEEKGGDLEAARTAYLNCLEQAPDHADALFNAAKVSLRLGELQAAREWLGRLKQADPEYPLTPVLEERLQAP